MTATAVACKNHLKPTNNITVDETLNDESDKYIPRKMPKFSSLFKPEYNEDEEDDIMTEHNLSMVIKIDRKKNKQLGINNRRLFIAISRALKYFAPDLKIALRNSSEDFDDFENVTQDDDELTDHYMESPTTSQNHIFTVKMHFRSVIPFHRIMHKNNELKHCLKTEGITLELNDITEIHLVNVGFFIKCHPRASIINSQVQRLTDLMEMEEEEIPEFMAYATPVWHNSEAAHVMMIKSGINEKEEVAREFASIANYTSMQFISWKYWKEVDPDVKNTIILTQQAYHEQYAQVILSKFKDNNEVKMNFGFDIDTIPDHLKHVGEMNISQYMKYFYKTAKGEPFIDIIYPPSNGVRELLVPRKYANQAFRWAKSVKAELYNVLSDTAKTMVFSDYEKVKKDASQIVEVWSGN